MSTSRGKIRSVRGYRRLIDLTIAQVFNGQLSAAEGQRRVSLAKAGAELLMAENLLHASGAVDEEVLHSLGDDGGEDIDREARPKVAGTKTVHTKRGYSPKGETSETTIKAVYEVAHDETHVPAAEPVAYSEDDSE